MLGGRVWSILAGSAFVTVLFLSGELGLLGLGDRRLDPQQIRASGRPPAAADAAAAATPCPTPPPLPPRTATTTTTGAFPREAHRALDPNTVELVIASYCEENSWFKTYPGPITIYSKKKGCAGTLQQAVDQSASTRGRVVELPNVGREGHSYIWHIVNNWCNLSTYTAFAQGKGEHNGVRVIDFMLSFLANGAPGVAHGNNEPHPPPLVPGKEMAVVPILHRNQKGYIFYRDKEEAETTGGMDKNTNVHVFNVPPDYVERQRLLYTLMYGGTVCDAPPMVFPAGAQFIVHKNAIYSKPLSFWKQLLVEFDRWMNFGYHAEREWLYIFDPSKKLTEWGRDCFRLPELFWGSQYHTWKCSATYQKYRGPEDLVHNSAGVLAPADPEHAPEPDECSGGTLRAFKYSKEPQKTCGLCSYVEKYKDMYKGGADAMVLQALREVEKATSGSLVCPGGGRRLSTNTSAYEPRRPLDVACSIHGLWRKMKHWPLETSPLHSQSSNTLM